MTKKRRRKGGSRDDPGDFQMMDIYFNPPSSVPTAASTSTTSTMINISQWDIDGDQIRGKSSLASFEDSTAKSAPLATDSTTQATFDYDTEVDSTFYNIEDESTFNDDEDINPEHDPSAKRSFLGVSHFHLTSITAVFNCILFIS